MSFLSKPNRWKKPSINSAILDNSHPLSRGLVGCYLLNESGATAYDLSTGRKHGTVVNNPTRIGGIFKNTSYSFNGSTQYINLSNMPVSSYPLTIMMWARCNDTTGYHPIFAIGQISGSLIYARIAFRGDVGGDPIEVCTANSGGGGTQQARTTVGYTAGRLHQITGVFSATNSRTVYLDGGNGVTDTNNVTGITPDKTNIAADANAPDAFFGGSIELVLVWNRALTTNEVMELYNNPFSFLQKLEQIKNKTVIFTTDAASTQPTKYGIYRYERKFDFRKPEIYDKLNRTSPLTMGLISCWLFNEGTGTTIKDYVGKFNGTTNNSPTREVFINGKTLKTVAGSSQYVSTGITGAELENGYTIIAGIIPTAFPGPGTSTIIGNNDASNSWAQVQLSFDDDGSIKSVISNDVSTDYKVWDSSSVSLTLTAGKHYVIAYTNNGTLDDSGNRLYVDGRDLALTGSETGIPNYPPAGFSGNLTIGRNGSNSSSYSSINYNFIYVYNRPLTSGEIAQITRNPYSIFETRAWRYVYQQGGAIHYALSSSQLIINSLTGGKYVGSGQSSQSIVINSLSSILKLLYASIPITSPNGCIITLNSNGTGLRYGQCGTTLEIDSTVTANSILATSLIEQLVINSSESVNIIASGQSPNTLQINSSQNSNAKLVGSSSGTLEIDSFPSGNTILSGNSGGTLEIDNSSTGMAKLGGLVNQTIQINNNNSCNIKVIGQNTLTVEIDSNISAQTSAGATIEASTLTELEINTIINGIKRLYGESSSTSQIIDTIVATKKLFGALSSSLEIDSTDSAQSKLGVGINPSLVISSSLNSNIKAGATSNLINYISSILSANSRLVGESQNQLIINDSIILNKLIRGESVTSLQLGSLIMSKLLLSAQINPTVQININSGSRCIYSGTVQDAVRISSNFNAAYRTLGNLSIPLRINVTANGSVLNIRYSIELPLNVNIATVLRHTLNTSNEVELEAYIARTILNSIFEI